MAIDPLHLVRQQRVLATGASEYKCPGCGRRTRDARGKCRSCIGLGMGNSLAEFSNEQLIMVVTNARAELARRIEAMKQAMREVDP